jgi:hypothetical protein
MDSSMIPSALTASNARLSAARAPKILSIAKHAASTEPSRTANVFVATGSFRTIQLVLATHAQTDAKPAPSHPLIVLLAQKTEHYQAHSASAPKVSTTTVKLANVKSVILNASSAKNPPQIVPPVPNSDITNHHAPASKDTLIVMKDA